MENDVKLKLDDIAKSYGLTISSLGAFILGQWIDSNNKKTGAPPPQPVVNHSWGDPLGDKQVEPGVPV